MVRNSIRRVSWAEEVVRDKFPVSVRAAFDEIYNEKGDLPLYEIEYGFSQWIVKDGRLVIPKNEADNDITTSEIRSILKVFPIPLAVVGEQYIEINQKISEPDSNQFVPYTPLRLLQQGEMFGVFEFMDRFSELELKSSPWQVLSGRSNILIRSKGKQNHITGRCSDFGIPTELWGDDVEILERIISTVGVGWRSKIIVISPNWFDVDKKLQSQLVGAISLICWRQSEVIREEVFNIDRINNAINKVQVGSADIKYSLSVLLKKIYDISHARFPCYALLENINSSPAKEVLDQIRIVQGETKPIFQPVYLGDACTEGYVSFSFPCNNQYFKLNGSGEGTYFKFLEKLIPALRKILSFDEDFAKHLGAKEITFYATRIPEYGSSTPSKVNVSWRQMDKDNNYKEFGCQNFGKHAYFTMLVKVVL